MRTLIAPLLAIGLAAVVGAQDPPKKDPPKPAKIEAKKATLDDEKDKKDTKSLKIGDPAPKLQPTKWLQGAEVPEFAPGKTYVVEFWATWCGPCIVMMPHLGEMQKEFKDKGVTVIGYSARDEGDKPTNNLESVTKFVEKRGPKLGYTFAYDDDRETYDAYMMAAGQNGIPCSYVVDQQGKIAFIGHPMLLDDVVPKVVDGSWKGQPDADAVLAGMEDFEKAFKAALGKDPEAGLKAVAELEAKRPNVAKAPYLIGPKLTLLVKAKKYDEAKAMAEGLIARAVQQDDPTVLRTVSAVLRADKDQKGLVKLAVEAAETGVKVAGDKDLAALMSAAQAHTVAGNQDRAKEFGRKAAAAAEGEVKGEKDALGLLRAAQAHLAAGDKAKAKEFGQKAIAAADNDRMKATLERMVKEFDEEKKDEKKEEKKVK